jgi:hypothetical protein
MLAGATTENRAKVGRKFMAAVDVFQQEPFPKVHLIRRLDNVLLSSNRAGGLPEPFRPMGEMIVDDLDLIFKNLPPVRFQKATRETVVKMRSKPVKTRRLRVDIETRGLHTTGFTLAYSDEQTANADVAIEIKEPDLLDLFMERLCGESTQFAEDDTSKRK